MGTRAAIRFYSSEGEVWVARFHDGYPEGVVPDLYILLEQTASPGEKLSPYEAASLFISAEKYSAVLEAAAYCNTVMSAALMLRLGFLDCRLIDPSEIGGTLYPEYIYHLNLEDCRLTIISCTGRVAEMNLKKAYEKYKKDYPNGCHIPRDLIRKLAEVLAPAGN